MYTYYVAGVPITDELYHDDLEAMTFGRRDQNELWHYGIKGQSWGKRRFQEEDGTLTSAGRTRYGVGEALKGITSGLSGLAKNASSAARTSPEKNSFGGAGASNSAGTSRTNTMRQLSSAGSSSPQGIRSSANSGRAAADRVFNSLSSARATSNQNGSNTGQPYVSNEYRQESAYNSQQNVYPEAMQPKENTDSNKNMTQEKKPGLFDRIGSAASNAASDVRNFVDEKITGNSARDRVDANTKWAQQLGKFAVDHPSVDNSKARQEAYSRIEENQAKADNSLFGRIGNAVNDARDWAGNAVNDVRDWGNQAGEDIGNAAKSAREWANQAGKDIDKSLSGVKDSLNGVSGNKDVEYLRNELSKPDLDPSQRYDLQSQLDNRIAESRNNTSFGEKMSQLGSTIGNAASAAASNAVDSAKEWVTGNKSREALDAAYAENRSNGGNGSSPEVDSARDAYNKTLPGMVEYARDNIRENVIPEVQERVENWANQAGKDIGSMLSDGSKEREELANAIANANNYRDDPEYISEFAKRYPEEAKQYLDEQKAAAEKLEEARKNYMDFSNNPVNTLARNLNLPNNKGNWAFAVPGNEQYLETMERGFIPKTENVADWFTGNNYKRTADKFNNYAADYDNLANEAYEYAKEAEKNGNQSMAQWFKDEGDYIKNVYGQQERDAANANMNLYNNSPRQRITNAASNVAEWGSGAVNNGRSALEKLFGKKK